MKMTKMMIAGGLVLTLGAFSPVFAQSSKDSTPQKASYSDTSNASSSPSSSDSATDQSQDQNSTSAQPSDESASSQNAASDNQQDQKDQASNQQDQNDQTSSSQVNDSSKNQQSEASASTTDLTQQQDRIQRQIRHLDRNLSDAESYETKAREALNDNKTAQAQRDFGIAEHILKMTTGGGSYQAAMLGENPQLQEKMTEKAIKRAKANGTNVSDAEHYYQDGKDALSKGNDTEASRNFRAAQLAAGVPVEVGYAEVWETKVPANESQNQTATASQQGSESGTGTQPNDQSAMNSSTDQTQKDDAQMFLRNGQEALKLGDKTQAQRDFRAAERALSMNETPTGNYPSSSK